MSETLLTVENLHTDFETEEGIVHAVNGVSFSVAPGEIVGLVGETGSGKSVTGRSLMRLEKPGEISDGSIRFRDTDLTSVTPNEIRRVRSRGMSMVFQNPIERLNPVYTVSNLIAEALKVNENPDSQSLWDFLHVPILQNRKEWEALKAQALELMSEVGIPNPEERIDAYPHEFSGGMSQRVMLAMALASEPELLIADEPTTALDVTIQAQILHLLAKLRSERNMAVLLITHDLGVISDLCDRVIVMNGGEFVEKATTEQLLRSPKHPYTQALLECLPARTAVQEPLATIEGEIPTPIGETSGCPFASRCRYANKSCRTGKIPRVTFPNGQQAKCERIDVVSEAQTTITETESARDKTQTGTR